MSGAGKVLLIYTGGTVGMLPADGANPESPLAPAPWERLSGYISALDTLDVEPVIYPMPLIDSSNMNPGYWIDLARVIGDNYDGYEGFVILHGTDTMSFTATALSFLLENLGKPVILTGSQIPLSEPRNDALQNILTSLMLAAPSARALTVVPEVCILFHDVLLRGNRARKVSASAYNGFASPNYGPLGRIGTHIELNAKLIRAVTESALNVHERLEDKVVTIDLFPGIQADILRRVFDSGIRGVILKTFGAGNAPTDREFLQAFEYAAAERELVIVNVTQCSEGGVAMGRYETGASLLGLGVVGGADMTPEAALVKLQFLLGRGDDPDTVKEMMQRNLRGELSPAKG